MSLEYDLYLKNTFILAKALIIKSEISANFINASLLKRFGSGSVDFNNPTTWKYYLNISGEYHITDTPMYVTSIDTQETILFSKENLIVNKGTYTSYMYGSNYYDNLVTMYPDQELLIMGILYPVDINLAISAKDNEILNYPDGLVQSNEYTLIRDLQTWIYNFSYRWNVYPFNYSDNLYASSQLAIMYLNIPAKILNLRLARCKTIEAHSYHVDTYLASNNNLNTYIDYLTLKQKLFLYRNIKYIQKYAGSTKIFKSLINRLLTEMGMPVYGVDIRKKLVDLSTYKSSPTCKTEALDNLNAYGIKQFYTPDEILLKELPDAFDNQFYYDKYSSVIDNKLTYTLSNYYKTKVLLSNIIDYNISTGFTKEDVVINNFGYLSYFNKLKITIPLTLSVGNTISLSSKDAFYLMIYLTYSLTGAKIKQLPVVYLNRALLVPLTDMSVTIGDVGLSKIDFTKVYNDIVSTLPSVYAFNSVQDFKSYSDELFVGMKNQYLYTSLINDLDNRAYVQLAVERFYGDFKLNTLLPSDLNVWLVQKSIDLSNYTLDDYKTLLVSLIENATGYSVDSENSLNKIQIAVMSALKKLSSYSIQPIYGIENNIIDMGGLTTRVSVADTNIDNGYDLILPDILGEDIYGNSRYIASSESYIEFPFNPVFSSVSINNIDPSNPYNLINVVPSDQRRSLESIY